MRNLSSIILRLRHPFTPESNEFRDTSHFRPNSPILSHSRDTLLRRWQSTQSQSQPFSVSYSNLYLVSPSPCSVSNRHYSPSISPHSPSTSDHSPHSTSASPHSTFLRPLRPIAQSPQDFHHHLTSFNRLTSLNWPPLFNRLTLPNQRDSLRSHALWRQWSAYLSHASTHSPLQPNGHQHCQNPSTQLIHQLWRFVHLLVTPTPPTADSPITSLPPPSSLTPPASLYSLALLTLSSFTSSVSLSLIHVLYEVDHGGPWTTREAAICETRRGLSEHSGPQNGGDTGRWTTNISYHGGDDCDGQSTDEGAINSLERGSGVSETSLTTPTSLPSLTSSPLPRRPALIRLFIYIFNFVKISVMWITHLLNNLVNGIRCSVIDTVPKIMRDIFDCFRCTARLSFVILLSLPLIVFLLLNAIASTRADRRHRDSAAAKGVSTSGLDESDTIAFTTAPTHQGEAPSPVPPSITSLISRSPPAATVVGDAMWDYFFWAAGVIGPSTIKFLQWASTRHDLFDPEFCKRCSRFHCHVSSHPFASTDLQLIEAMGDDWRKKLAIHPEPIGSGCMAQVYRGALLADVADVGDVGDVRGLDPMGGDELSEVMLTNCYPVAVKICHPGVKEQVELDLLLLHFIARLMSLLPSMKYIPLVEGISQFEAVMKDQVDLSLEAHNLISFKEEFSDAQFQQSLLKASNGHVVFPSVYPVTTGRKVLMQSLEQGISLSQLLLTSRESKHLKASEASDRRGARLHTSHIQKSRKPPNA
eukprot:GHVN01079747.1.p1 GENE.GHVN01079747.1~~GHVN01079747.1.p1  ORF type:complete len:757 (-),score=171.18 GHVN01079747.1:18-2288(-)